MSSPKRNFFLNKDVDASSLKDIIEGIIAINDYDDKESDNKVKYERIPIKLTIDSYGGECYTGMALVNLIESSKTPVHTYCYGKAMSMGLAIYAVGHKRFAHKKAFFMQHQLSGGTEGKLLDMKEGSEQQLVLQKILDSVLIEHSNITKKQLKKYRKKKLDWYFTGKEAFKLGLVDELLESAISRPEK